eukprot:TRINITY_DN566_c0_g1_i1.p1 TRINITY_DN566_c0_g1~~TRINITY_DN566_c0_g1_i1.p1  ORF type:complete len:806 (+),score=399.41 TRINITY_DN566_c0_g1_i1:87-2420(+)
MVYGTEIYTTFMQGLEAGMNLAPHDEWETVTDPSLEIDPLFTSQATLDVIVSILAMVATISASASGIGGGGLLVPIYLLVMGWHVSNAVPLSNATIFGNAITNIIINFPLRHPTADRPLVDFDLALILIPMELTGSLVGVLLNIMFPQWLTLLCLLILLMITTYRTYHKGRATWDKENKERAKVARQDEAAKAAVGDAKRVYLEDENGTELEFEVVHGADKASTTARVLASFGVKGEMHATITDKDGERVRFEFSCVDADEHYAVRFVEVAEDPSLCSVDYSFRATFSGRTPTPSDHAKLIVMETGSTGPKRHLGKGQPIDTWTTEMVISFVQTFTDSSDALCHAIETAMVSGTDLLLWTTNVDVAHKDLERLGVTLQSERDLILAQVLQLAEEDYMLLVHNMQDLPWGSWNRSAEWQEGDEQEGDRDLDGWLPDDPNHPKHRTATYVSSQAYVNIYKWDTEDVVRWLNKVTDYNYALKEAVRKNDINGNALMQLTSEDLKQLGVPQLGPRLALLSRIAELETLYKEHEAIVVSERKIPYSTTVLVLFLSWLMLLILAILKGGGKSGGQSPVAQWEGKSQEDFCGSATFWVLWWIGVPVLVVVTYISGNYLLDKHQRKVKTHFAFHEGDIRWTERSVRLYPAIVIIAGVLAGLLGVGGAMVTGPLMLELGMMPRVSTATSSFLIIFTTGVAAIAYISLGTLKLDYGIWFALMGGTGAALGLNIIGMLLKKYNRQSMVIWSLTLVFILAAIGTTAAGVMRLSKDISEGNSLGLREICG